MLAVKSVLTPVQAPKVNEAEERVVRVVRMLKRERLDHMGLLLNSRLTPNADSNSAEALAADKQFGNSPVT
ncbi:MAG: hypothetical protein ABIH46_12875 [Chloroflexota bacterium]